MAENSSDVRLSDLVAAKTAGSLVVWSGLNSGLTPPPPDEKAEMLMWCSLRCSGNICLVFTVSLKMFTGRLYFKQPEGCNGE